jgi:hypothetical protein
MLSLAAGTAAAVPVTWTATGNIIFASSSDQLPLDAQVGDVFSYSVTFEDETPDNFPGYGVGYYENAILGVVLSIGGESFDIPVGPTSSIQISDSLTDPYRQVPFYTADAAPGTYPVLYTQLAFWSSSPLAPTGSDALLGLTPPPDLSIYQSYFYMFAHLTLEQATGLEPAPFVQGHVTSVVVEPTSVPEPATLGLLAASLLGAGLARRRRR